jgi:hypothetical protein
VLFDRSWYNRSGVERVIGFATEEQVAQFFRDVPEFERMLVRSGIRLVKYWFSITDEEQQMRFLVRIHDPLKQWKLSPMGLQSRVRWEAYTKAKEETFARTSIPEAPLVHRRGQRQEAGAAQLHRSSALADSLRGPAAPGHRPAGAGLQSRIRAQGPPARALRALEILSGAFRGWLRFAPTVRRERRWRPAATMCLSIATQQSAWFRALRREPFLAIRLPVSDQGVRAAQRDGECNSKKKVLGIRMVGGTNYA